jgi:hypothetical protein
LIALTGVTTGFLDCGSHVTSASVPPHH